MKYYRISSVILFVAKLKGDEKIDEDELWNCLFYILVMEVAGK